MLSYFITILYLLDRVLKLVTVVHFFSRPMPQRPAPLPTIALLQPITYGATNLAGNLRARFEQEYAAPLQHILLCDAGDATSISLCREICSEYPAVAIRLVTVTAAKGTVAAKIEKLNAGLRHTAADVYAFIDDDIAPPPSALDLLMRYLYQPGVGAVFGLARAISWNTPWSSLMSLFVNSQALLNYIPLTYFLSPYAITGHFYAIRAVDFARTGGFQGMDHRVDDDNGLARNLAAVGLRSIQTPLIYSVSNEFRSWHEYASQIHRWFIIPRQTIIPYLTLRQQAISTLLSASVFLPPLQLLLFFLAPGQHNAAALLGTLLIFGSSLLFIHRNYLRQPFPWHVLHLLPLTAYLTPLQIIWALTLAGPTIHWRGQRLIIHRGGEYTPFEN
jgi:ceramide glucosyltransferase